MSGTADYDVGYGKPPRASRWKKGHTGNPEKVRSKKPKKKWKLVEKVFAAETILVENGAKRRVTVFEAIALKLWVKATTGNKRAFKALQKYEAFAKTKPDTFVIPETEPKEAAKEYARMRGFSDADTIGDLFDEDDFEK